MKFSNTIAMTALAALVTSAPAAAFETKRPEPEQRLEIEIEPVTPLQQSFDRYIRELAAAAQRDARAARQEKDRIAELEAKAVNPLTLLRW